MVRYIVINWGSMGFMSVGQMAYVKAENKLQAKEKASNLVEDFDRDRTEVIELTKEGKIWEWD
jgi:hypothetical protein